MQDRAHTVVVDGIDVCDALGAHMALDGFSMEPPSVRTSYIDVPGRSGSIDLSDALTGYPVYGDRTIRVAFIAESGNRAAGEALLSRAMRTLHGRRAEITLSWDPEYTYEGRITVSALRRYREVVGFTMEARCDPFKLRERVSVTKDCAGGTWIDLECGDYRAVPTFVAPSEASIYANGVAYDLQAGVWRLPGAVLSPGGNRLFVATTGEDGEARLLSSCADDALSAWAMEQISDWMWSEKPTGGPVTVEYDWKDL